MLGFFSSAVRRKKRQQGRGRVEGEEEGINEEGIEERSFLHLLSHLCLSLFLSFKNRFVGLCPLCLSSFSLRSNYPPLPPSLPPSFLPSPLPLPPSLHPSRPRLLFTGSHPPGAGTRSPNLCEGGREGGKREEGCHERVNIFQTPLDRKGKQREV